MKRASATVTPMVESRRVRARAACIAGASRVPIERMAMRLVASLSESAERSTRPLPMGTASTLAGISVSS
eukprot:6213434-Pleurochrysis_carterae.AAC.1